ncbi:MAG: hypothetical protein U0441_28790 [Polyangiaceae bacterium]
MMSRPHRTVALALFCGATLVTAALAAPPAFAKKPLVVAEEDEATVPPPPPDPPEPPPPPRSPYQEGAGMLLFGFGSFAAIDGLGLAPSGDDIEPDPLKNKHLRLAGGGHLAGGGMRIDIFGRWVRGGVTLSVFGVEGTHLAHDPLANGFRAEPASGWGAGFEVFVGHEFAKGPVRPYLDLTTSVDILSTQIDLVHPAYGRVGRTQYEGWLFGFGPRAGLTVPLGDHAYFDVSGTYTVLGAETFRLVGGIGFWGR